MNALDQLKKCAETAPLHVCIDLASAPDGLKRITGSSRPLEAVCLFEEARTTNAADASPWLLSCPANRIDSWLPRSLALAKESPSVTWLFGPLETEELRSRMVRRLDVMFKDGTELMLRIFDPRILSELNIALSSETHSHFFSLCEHWCSLDRNGSLFEVISKFAATTDPMDTSLILNELEEHALLLASEAGQVLAETLKRWPDDLLKIPPKDRFNLSKDCCVEANKSGLDNLADKVLLLMHAADQPQGYLKTPEWFALRELLVSGKRTLISLFQEPDTAP